MAVRTNRLLPYLDEHEVHYETVHHKLDYTAQETAADTHTPGEEFAKVVIVRIDGRFAMFVLAAPQKVDFSKARQLLGHTVVLANENEVADLFDDCEVGAEPPFGNLYGLTVYVTPQLADEEQITFNGGTHHDSIRMSYSDFHRLVRPEVLDMGWSP